MRVGCIPGEIRDTVPRCEKRKRLHRRMSPQTGTHSAPRINKIDTKMNKVNKQN